MDHIKLISTLQTELAKSKNEARNQTGSRDYRGQCKLGKITAEVESGVYQVEVKASSGATAFTLGRVRVWGQGSVYIGDQVLVVWPWSEDPVPVIVSSGGSGGASANGYLGFVAP